MKTTRVLSLFLLLAMTACSLPTAAPATEIQMSYPTASENLVPVGEFDRSKLGTVESDVTYCTMDGVALKLDLYYPDKAKAPWPVVVYVHGGAWKMGSKTEGESLADVAALREAGFLFVAINYRLAPEYQFPAMIEDAKCAIRFLRAHAAEYNLDPDKIGAIGGSAGGHLVSLLGLADESAGWEVGEYLDQSSRVQAVVDYYGPADLTDASFSSESNAATAEEVFGVSDQNDPRLAAASPVTYISPDDPPFLIFHGDQDTAVPLEQSQLFYDALTAAGLEVTFVIVRNAEHGFAPSGGAIQPPRKQITVQVVDFFIQHLK